MSLARNGFQVLNKDPYGLGFFSQIGSRSVISFPTHPLLISVDIYCGFVRVK